MDDHAAVGDTDRAFEWLDKAFQERPSEMISFGVGLEMDPLRADPRYHRQITQLDVNSIPGWDVPIFYQASRAERFGCPRRGLFPSDCILDVVNDWQCVSEADAILR
jgi:hypothetical protein